MIGKRFLLLLLLTLISAIYVPNFTSANSSPPTWTDSAASPTIQKNSTISQAEYSKILGLNQGYRHQECVKKKIPTHTKPYVRHYDGCWFTTSLGLLEQGGKYLVQNGEQTAAYVRRDGTDNSKLSPTPNPDVFLELISDAGTGYGHFVNLRKAYALEFNKQIHSLTGSITLTYKNPGKIISSDSGLLHIESNYVWYSSNTKWMMIWGENTPNALRVNLSTLEVKGIYIRNKPSGFYLRGHAAISNDGRYIAVSLYEGSFSELYIQDLNDCTSTGPFTYLEIVKCKNRTLKSFLQTNINGYVAAYMPRFYSNDTLGFYHKNTDKSYTLYTLQAPNTETATLDYLAMGDSFASGEGAFNYEDGTDDPVNKCHLSKKSYPYLINQQMALSSFRSVACSGAKIKNVLSKQQEEKPLQNPLGDWLPGYQPQMKYLQNNLTNPNIITISMSGNDIGFADKVTYCVAYANDCFDTYEDRLEIIREINSKFDAIADMYQQIKQAVSPNAKIYAVGYPQIVSSDIKDKCGANVHLSAQERLFANQLITYFNKVIKNAAAKEGVLYVGIESSLYGNRLCEANKAGIAVNGLTAGKDDGAGPIKVIGKESYHPNTAGHFLMKNALLEKTDHFTKPMPSPNPSSTAPDETETPLLEAPKSGRKINKTNYDGNSGNNVYYHGGWLNETVSASAYKLVPFRDYFIELHSEPVRLGTITSDINGDLTINVQIPETVPPGMHTLHIYGQNTDGKDIDIYRYVYVGASETDFDGNGIPDNEEACLVVEASGVDQDKDRVDDACDSVITAIQESPQTQPAQDQPSSQVPHEATTPNTAHHTVLQNNATTSLQPATLRNTFPIHTNSMPNVLAENTPTHQTNAPPNTQQNHTTNHEPKNMHESNTATLIAIVCGVLFISVSIMLYAKSRRKP